MYGVNERVGIGLGRVTHVEKTRRKQHRSRDNTRKEGENLEENPAQHDWYSYTTALERR
jgi:hypothetical protein